MAHDTLHVINVRRVARDLHTVAPWPLERTCWRQMAAQRGDCKKSRTAPVSAVIIIIIIIITVITIAVLILILLLFSFVFQ